MDGQIDELVGWLYRLRDDDAIDEPEFEGFLRGHVLVLLASLTHLLFALAGARDKNLVKGFLIGLHGRPQTLQTLGIFQLVERHIG